MPEIAASLCVSHPGPVLVVCWIVIVCFLGDISQNTDGVQESQLLPLRPADRPYNERLSLLGTLAFWGKQVGSSRCRRVHLGDAMHHSGDGSSRQALVKRSSSLNFEKSFVNSSRCNAVGGGCDRMSGSESAANENGCLDRTQGHQSFGEIVVWSDRTIATRFSRTASRRWAGELFCRERELNLDLDAKRRERNHWAVTNLLRRSRSMTASMPWVGA